MKLAYGLLAASVLFAADYRAGVARVEGASAVAIEDSRGGRVVIAAGGGSELVAARVAKEYGLERARLVLVSCGGPGGAATDAVVTAIGGALGDLKPAQIRFGTAASGPVLEVMTPEGAPLAALSGGSLALGMPKLAGEGRRVHGPVRAAFQVVELGRELSSRGAEVRSVSWVQAVRLGKDVTLVSLADCGCAVRIAREFAVMVAGPSGSGACPPEVEAAVARLLRRLGR